MIIAFLFRIAKKWNLPKYPSPDEWVNKVWHTMKYYLAIKVIKYRYF